MCPPPNESDGASGRSESEGSEHLESEGSKRLESEGFARTDPGESLLGRYEAILGTIRDPVFTVDSDGLIAYVNDALCSLAAASPSALHGTDPESLFEGAAPPELERAVHSEPDAERRAAPSEAEHARSITDASQFTDGRNAEVRVRTADGAVVTYESRVSRIDDAEDAAACVLRDVSERVEAKSELAETNCKVTAIHEFASDVSTAETVRTVLEEVVDAAGRILEFDRCVATRRDGKYLYPAVTSAEISPEDVRPFALGEGIAGRTVAEQRTFVLDEIDRSPDADPVPDDVRSGLSVPIGEHGNFQAVSEDPGAFNDDDAEFAELLASHASEAITQIRTERELRTERDRLAALFENVPLPATRVLFGPNDECTLDATNDAFEETFGYSAAEHDYHDVLDGMVPPDERTVRSEAVDARGEPVTLETKRRTTEGVRDFVLHVIPADHDEGLLAYRVYADIGERKRIERTLRELHEATREMFHAEDRESVAAVATRASIDTLGFPNSGVRLYDPSEGVLQPTAISAEATEVLGERPAFGPDDGSIWHAYETDEIVHLEDVPAADTAIAYGDLGSLLVVPLGDHGVMPFGSPEPEEFGETDVQLARVLAANVTVALDRAERAERIRERDAALQREIDRLEKFAGLVSHDLRNPLNVAAGRLELARDHVDDEEALTELDRAEDAHDRMLRLIDDLLALARQGQTVDEPGPVSLEETARRAWRTVDTADATLDGPTSESTVEADQERLRTLLENLFRNAVEHGGPTVTIAVELLDDGGFAVADDGSGFAIDPDRALEYGVSDRSDDTGFGLAIVREIATAHGWELLVSDDDGARFEFRTT